MHERWRPSRAGLIALWRYWDETFTFHHGRLLLRGPNGSGKSMALELLLPFLLDGDTSPARLTSSGKTRGRLFDRLMTGTSEQSRTGYAWVEFARDDEVFTVGARIRGSRSTQKTDVDLFTTSLAVGRGLHLLDDTRTPLSRKALVEAIGETGRVHATAEEHRAAVRDTLFPGFSAERYDSVIGALLALRKEKLSEKLDAEKLSVVLSEALPPLDDHDIAVVAEGFERLDRRRDALAELQRDVEEVRQLARRQRAYAQVVVVAAAGSVRSAETTRDDVTRGERAAREQLSQAQARDAEARAERDQLTTRIDEIAVEVDALKDSEAYRAGAGLTDLRHQADQLRGAAQRAGDRVTRTETEHVRARERAEHAEEEWAAAEANERRARDEVTDAARSIGAEAAVAQAQESPADEAETLLSAWVRAQRVRVTEVRAALDAHHRAVAERGVHERRVAEDEQVVAERTVARDDALRAEDKARAQYATAVRDWAGRCETVGVDRLRDALPPVPEDPVAVHSAVAEVRSAFAAEDAVARERVSAERASAEVELTRWRAERKRWESSELVDPDGPAWRTSREGRPGAPLWRLVDPAPDLPDQTLDALERALSGAGLIDAWVRPDGSIQLGPGDADIQLGTRAARGRTLGEVLVPAGGDGAADAVTAEVIAAVLASIPIADTALSDDERDVVVGLDGSYRLGNAVGRGPGRPALLLGAVVRERHRLARLAEIDAEIETIGRTLTGLDRRLTILERRRAAVEAELAAQPTGDEVTDAAALVAETAARLSQAEESLAAARAQVRDAEERVRTALRELTTLAARHGLPAEPDALGALETALTEFTNATATWARRRREATAAARRHAETSEATDSAAHEADLAIREQRDADRDAAEAEQRLRVLLESVGADYQQILDRIATVQTERDRARARLRVLGAEVDDLQRGVGALGEEVKAAEARRRDAEALRDRTQRRFVAAVGALGGDARLGDGLPLDTPTAVLSTARALAADHENLDTSDREIERRSQAVAERVHQAQSALGARADFDRELADEGWWVLRTSSGGVRRRIGDLVAALAGQLDEGRAELAADEERLFEQTLAGSVRRALADRIRQATALVDGINRQLGAIKTAAAGVAVQLRWEVDPEQPPAVRAARSLLLRDPADLTDQERGSLQEFVRARVEQARAELEANAPWEARLRESLDYRAWHRFTLQIAHRDWTGYLPATGQRLQRLSTGERSIALHLPMIASVAAHYADEDGQPGGCPRLILLDELFAGVDTPNRAQLFGAFTTWELDAVFTSDHEWCQYADLDGIAIHYLHPPVGDEPVTSTRFTWDGIRRVIDPAA